MIRFAVLALIAFPAFAEDRMVRKSRVMLEPTEQPGAVAEVRFLNSQKDFGGRYTETFSLTAHGVSIAVTATVGTSDPDTIIVTVPDDFIALPDRLTIPDGSASVLFIYPLEAVGM